MNQENLDDNSGLGVFSPTELAALLAALFCIHLTSRYSYLLFHALAEFFSISVAMTIFFIAINNWKLIRNQYLIFIGISYAFIALLDTLHALSYAGMGVFTDYDYYAPQFWIASRMMEATSMLGAFSFLGTRLRLSLPYLIIGFSAVSISVVLSILYFRNFPVCFVPGQGLTFFKKASEYVIIGVFIVNLVILHRKQAFFDPRVYRLIKWSLYTMIGMELSFTLYTDNAMSGAFNQIGHLLKIAAFYLVYKAIVVTGIKDPVNLLFRDLQKKQEELIEAQKLALLGSWELDLASRIWVWSEGMYHLLGLPLSSEPAPKSLAPLMEEEALRSLERTILSSASGEKDFEIDLPFKTPRGSRILSMRGTVVRDGKGNAVKLIGTLQDISDRIRLLEMESIAREKEKFELLLQTSGDGIHLLDRDGNVIECNQRFCSMLGYSYEEMLGMNVSQWDVQLQQKDLEEKIGKIFLEPEIFETQHRRKDGKIIDVEISAKSIEYAGRKVLWNSSRDITARKKIEAETRISATAFESQEGMIITDAQANIIRVNKSFTSITGYAPEEVIGKNPRFLSSGRHDAAFYEGMWKSIISTGTWQGELWNRRKNGEVYPQHLTISTVIDPNNKVVNYVGAFSDVTLLKQNEEKILHMAFYDHLTNLPNRSQLMNRMLQAMTASGRSHKHCAILFIDLDNFKDLNDTLGHEMGDVLLQQVAERLQGSIREGDTVSRLGGDEFVVMLENLQEDPLDALEQSRLVGNKILSTLNRPFSLSPEKSYSCTSSIGITLFQGKNQNANELLKQADIAMYQAKKTGRNTLSFFDKAMQKAIDERVALETALRSGLERRDFVLYYQIQKNALGQPIGAEALLRWNHPIRGIVSPGEFIHIAEETGLIIPIGNWVIETACERLKAWENNPGMENFSLSVNVSARQFHQENFTDGLIAQLNHFAINPSLLKLELTESMLLEDIEHTIRVMRQLKETGVTFSLDDFGTGYSSLQYLRRLPLDQLKIDQSFVRDIATDDEAMTIVKTIIAMADSLNISVIAEGVETEKQAGLLEKAGCRNYQGYLFSKPVPVEQMEALIQSAIEKIGVPR